MTKRPKNLDLNQLAKRILDESVGDEPIEPTPEVKNQAAVDKGRLGGVARHAKLTPEQKIDLARLAANARWKKETR